MMQGPMMVVFVGVATASAAVLLYNAAVSSAYTPIARVISTCPACKCDVNVNAAICPTCQCDVHVSPTASSPGWCTHPFFTPSKVKSIEQSKKFNGPWKKTTEYWNGNPSLFWEKLDEPMISMDDLAACQKVFDWKQVVTDAAQGVGGLVSETYTNPNFVGLSPRCYQYWRYMPSWSQYTNLYSAATNIFGQDAIYSHVMMGGGDRLFLDFLLMAFPQAKNFVEFGTASGTTSIYAGIAMRMRGGKLTTFDMVDGRTEESKLVWNDEYMVRMYADILRAKGPCKPFSCEATNQKVIDVIAAADIFLIDNGVKDKECFLYAKHLPIGSIAFVHDMYFDQALYDLFDQPFRFYGYEAVYKEFAESQGAHMRAWRRVASAATPELLTQLKEPNKVHPAEGGLQ